MQNDVSKKTAHYKSKQTAVNTTDLSETSKNTVTATHQNIDSGRSVWYFKEICDVKLSYYLRIKSNEYINSS